jgi:BASS family bile acid:Na+ symporter
MILVASCPGGNVSNFITHLAGGNTAVSVSMTAISTAAATVLTPLNIALWGSLDPGTAGLLRQVAVDPVGMISTVMLVLAVPLVLGMVVAARAPRVAARLRRPMRIGSLGFFALFVVLAFRANVDHFVSFIGLVFAPVLVQNALAFGLGWGLARVARLAPRDVRAVTIEVGIQNSGLGLVLVFTFFGGLGGTAIVAAWWGIWHIVAGMTLALFWSRRPLARPLEEATT